MSHSRWNLLPPVPDEHLKTGFPRLIAQLLYNRGITGPGESDSFLAADESLSGNPEQLSGIPGAVSRIYRALLSREKIAVYGDFDADGITATALLVQGFSMLGCDAVPYIPNRLTEGYGLRAEALDNLREQGVSLVVTVDCGITAVQEVRHADKIGLDIIITDHHVPLDELPGATAVINPKLADSVYPTRELAGVGVALKLLQALFTGLGREQNLECLTDLAALGTVADMVPLLGENRFLVRRGLEIINGSPRPGIKEIINRTSLTPAKISSANISWTIAPRLNAAGRVEDAMSSYRLLMTDSTAEAQQLAEWLEQKNAERQKMTAETLETARRQVQEQADMPLLIACGPDFPAGIIGLVAGRLAEEYYRPAIVIRTGDRYCGGSCRSIPEFDIISALTRCSHLLTHFGGHSRAAGLSLHSGDLTRLREALLAIAAAELEGVELRPRIDIDAAVTLPELGGDTWQSIQKMEPFGQGNPNPVFLSREVEVVMLNTMGANNNHLRMKLRQGTAVFDAVGFGLGGYISEAVSPLNIVYNLEMDNWNGQSKLRLNLLDFEPARQYPSNFINQEAIR